MSCSLYSRGGVVTASHATHPLSCVLVNVAVKCCCLDEMQVMLTQHRLLKIDVFCFFGWRLESLDGTAAGSGPLGLSLLSPGLVNNIRRRGGTRSRRAAPFTPPSHASLEEGETKKLPVPAGTHPRGFRRPGRSPPGRWSRRCRCHLQSPAPRSRSPTPTSSRIPQRCSAPWNASCPTDFPFKKTCKHPLLSSVSLVCALRNKQTNKTTSWCLQTGSVFGSAPLGSHCPQSAAF